MATDRNKPDMHAEIEDTGEETDRTKFRQTRPEAAKVESPAKTFPDHLRPRPHTSGITIATTSRGQHTSPAYKTTHPIGSRKVTENVITYHEPIFQSLANTWFESQRNLTMGKRKLEEDHEKMESVSPDSKKRRVENLQAGVSDPNMKIKKKCTIENIIDRIRTEKTQSRGTGAMSQADAGEGCSKSGDTQKLSATTARLSDVITPKEAIDKLAKHSAHKMSCGLPIDLSGKTMKIEDGGAVIKKEKSETPKKKEKIETPKKTANDKISESPNPTKMEVKQEATDLSSSMKFTKLVESSKDRATDRRQDTEGKKPSVNSLPQKSVRVTQSCEDICKNSKSQLKNELTNVPKKEKKKQVSKDKDNKKKLTDKKVKVRKKQTDSENEKKKESPPNVKSNKKTSKAKTVKELLQERALDKKTDVSKSKEEDNAKGKTKEKKEETETKKKEKIKKQKSETLKTKKAKTQVFQGRAKRVASLNASTFMNILYERSPKSPKSPKLLNTKRSKSESDLATTPHKALPSSFSYTNVANVNTIVATKDKSDHAADSTHESLKSQEETSIISTTPDLKSALKSPKKERFSPKGTTDSMKGMLSESKHVSPKRKISFNDEIHIDDECINDVFNDISKTGKGASAKVDKNVKKTSVKTEKTVEDNRSTIKTSEGSKPRARTKKSCILPAKSPEELAERKKKANIARLQKAKEILMTKRKKASIEDDDDVLVDSDSSSDTDETEKQSSDDSLASSTNKIEEENTVIKSRAKRGELFRAARTHISVEAKTVFENTASSPKWCECCQTSYFPSQPHQGMKVWLLKQLVDKGSSRAPEPIQSSSHHFITAHASCEVRPYSSPTHVPMMESSPYVGPLVSHGHVTCSGCGCGHGGMLHTAQCQNYSLGGVGNILSCQHYSGTYTVPYPHSSYTRCGCTSCCPGSSYHHAGPGQPLLHQPPPPQQIPISTADAASILLHRQPLQLQMAPPPPHDPPPPHSMPSMQLSHSESATLSSHAIPLHLSHKTTPTPTQAAESAMPHLDQSCHCLPGEVTNVTQVVSNTQSDIEYIDVGNEDIVSQKASNQRSSSSSLSSSVQQKSGNQNKKNGSKLAETVNKLTHAKTEKLKQKLKESREQLNKKLNVNKLLGTKNTSLLQSKDKKKTIVLEAETSKKKVKLLDPKKKKVSDTDQQLDKGSKKGQDKGLPDKKVASKKGKKEAGPASNSSDLLPSLQIRKNSSGSENQLEKASKKGLDKKVVNKKGKNVGVDVAKVEEEELEGGASEREEMREESRAWHGWSWEGEGTVKKVTNIFDGKEVQRKCYNAIQHDDGEIINVKDCILVCSGRKMRDIPYVAKVTNFWEEPASGEMMMTILWYYRPEHIEGGRKPEHQVNELFAAKHRDESLVACIEDKGYVLTYNEYCRYMGEVRRTKNQFPLRKRVVPDLEDAPPSYRMPPIDVDPENVFLCRHVYDLKLKRVLKNPS